MLAQRHRAAAVRYDDALRHSEVMPQIVRHEPRTQRDHRRTKVAAHNNRSHGDRLAHQARRCIHDVVRGLVRFVDVAASR